MQSLDFIGVKFVARKFTYVIPDYLIEIVGYATKFIDREIPPLGKIADKLIQDFSATADWISTHIDLEGNIIGATNHEIISSSFISPTLGISGALYWYGTFRRCTRAEIDEINRIMAEWELCVD